jgi:Subtilase family
MMFRFTTASLFAPLAVLVSGLCNAQEVPWNEVSEDEEVIYVEEVSVDAAGSIVSAMTTGSIVLELESGAQHVLDLETLVDPDGNQYFIAGGAYQIDETDPVTYRFRVVRYQPSVMTEEEIAAAWSEANPGATEAELLAFMDARDEVVMPTDLGIHVDAAVEEWLAEADSGDLTEVVLILADQPPFDLPQAPNALLENEPAYWFEAMEQRLLAIEDRKTEITTAQQGLVQDLESVGGSVLSSAWLHNTLAVEVPAVVLADLVVDPRIRSVTAPQEVQLADCDGDPFADHDGVDAREATQTWMYLDDGYDGSHGTGRSSEDHIYVLIADGYVDVDHPAWDYWDEQSQSFVSRCLGSWYWNGSQWESGSHQSNLFNRYKDHGNKVTATILADLMDGQDTSPSPSLTSDERAGITGIAPAPVFTFLEYKGSFSGLAFTRYVEKAMELNVDLINFSLAGGNTRNEVCQYTQWAHEALIAVNDAMKDGIFVVQAAGNYGNGYVPSFCSVVNPGGASGAFVVGELDRLCSADLDTAEIWNDQGCTGSPPGLYDPLPECGSGRGGDEYGRPLVKVVTPGGRAMHPPNYDEGDPFLLWPMYKDCNHPEFWVHTYWPTQNQVCKPSGGGGNATSWATPVATGAAALLRDFFVQDPNMPWPHHHLVGHVFSHMLLMGDGHLEGDGEMEGGNQTATTPLDELYGAGRLRMRLFTDEGMDAPWFWDFVYFMEDDGEIFYYPIHKINQTNYPVPTGTDWFRASLWWYEPNLGDAYGYPVPTSSVKLSVVADDGAPSYTCSSLVPQSQRLWLGNIIAGEPWSLRVQGLDIPPSLDEDYYHLQERRPMYLSFFWEGRDRMDPDGPSEEDDIY